MASECPKCPYCGWEVGEWADGKTKVTEKIKCPTCEKSYWCHTYWAAGWFHVIRKIGRNAKL